MKSIFFTIKSKLPNSTKRKIEGMACALIKRFLKTISISYRGYRVFLPARDNCAAVIYFRYLLTHFWEHEIFEQKVVQHLLERHMSDVHFIDGGASYGLYSLLASSTPTVNKTYAIECLLETCHWLKRTIFYNHLEDRVDCIHAAISSSSGGTHFVQASDHSEWNKTLAAVGNGRSASQYEKVETLALDDLIFDQLGLTKGSVFIKLDLEGNEYSALKGLQRFFSSGLDYVLFTEIHTGILQTEEAILKYAQELWDKKAAGVYDVQVRKEQGRIVELNTFSEFADLLREYAQQQFPCNLTNILLCKRKISPQLLKEIGGRLGR